MEISFSAPPPPPDAACAATAAPLLAPAAAQTLPPVAAVSSSPPQQQTAVAVAAAVVAPPPADDKVLVSGGCRHALVGHHPSNFEFECCRHADFVWFPFSHFVPAAVEVLLHASSAARHEDVKVAVERFVLDLAILCSEKYSYRCFVIW
jgi:hypothetical protein